MKTKNIIIIGNGMVGHKFCEKLIKKTSEFKTIIFGEEPRSAYDRVHLSEYFNGKTAHDLSLSGAGWYTGQGIDLYLNDPVIKIDKSNKIIYSSKGNTVPYDYLIFATGSSAFIPSIPGIDKEGVFVYRTIDDLDLIKNYAKKAKKGTVLGGGLLGLEAAKALQDLNIRDTSVIEYNSRLMPKQIDSTGSNILKNKLKELGLSIYLNKSTASVEGKERITGLKFTDGTELQTDILIVSAGIRPRDELAKACELKTGERGGIAVNQYMQTSDPNIY